MYLNYIAFSNLVNSFLLYLDLVRLIMSRIFVDEQRTEEQGENH